MSLRLCLCVLAFLFFSGEISFFLTGTSSINIGQMGPTIVPMRKLCCTNYSLVEPLYKNCTKLYKMIMCASSPCSSVLAPVWSTWRCLCFSLSAAWKAHLQFQFSSGHSSFNLWDNRGWIREADMLWEQAYHRGPPQRGPPMWQMNFTMFPRTSLT